MIRNFTILVSVTLMMALVLPVSPIFGDDTPDNTFHPEFPYLADSPYPRQHSGPENADYIDVEVKTEWKQKWHALIGSAIPQPVSSGPQEDSDRANIYCTRMWDPVATGKANLIALDSRTGEVLWDDSVDGVGLLNEQAWISAPLVDAEGNVYAADTERLVKFTSDGKLLWNKPIFESLYSEQGLPNPPFGLNMLPSGELVMATMGDGWVLVVDRQSGEVLAQLDLPSAKIPGFIPPNPWLTGFASPEADLVLRKIAMGQSEYEIDNDIAVDPHHSLIFITGGAPAPNVENYGGLWAVHYDGSELSVRFYVKFTQGTGGSGTTPTVSSDGQYVLVADNAGNVVAVDIPAALDSTPPGGEFTAYASKPVMGGLGASFAITPDNRVFVPAGSHIYVLDVSRDDIGDVQLEEAMTSIEATPLVLTAFKNVIAFPEFTGDIVLLDANDGSEIFRYILDNNIAANVSMAAGKNNSPLIGNMLPIMRENALGGVIGWK